MSKRRIELPQSFAPHVRAWLTESLPADVEQSLARLSTSEDVQQMAILPDVHLAGASCVGVALATSRLIYPAAVGSDVGCGIATVRIGADAGLLADKRSAARVLSALYDHVPANRHRSGRAVESLPDELLAKPLSDSKLESMKSRDGRVQFGTLGGGNHFFEFQADAEQCLWLAVHSGSRAIGQTITRYHLKRATKTSGYDVLDAEAEPGAAYLRDVDWAIEYAQANRLAMLRAMERWLAAKVDIAVDWNSLIHTHHDHVRRETHDGRELWVHRKGAQPADEGELGIVPGSMGSATYHITGRGRAESLRSCSHGAGRAIRRGEAFKRIAGKQLLRELDGVWFDHRRAEQLRDEAPSAYKEIGRVMRAQRDLVRIERELRPVLCYKGK